MLRVLLIAALLALPAPAQELTATIEKLERTVEVQRGGLAWEPAVVGMKLAVGDKIHTGFKATATVKFGDSSTLAVQPMTMVMLQKLEDPDGKVKTRVWLRLGEVKAKVERPSGTAADFQVRTTTATASVRGTEIQRIAVHPGTGTVMEMGDHGRIEATSRRGRAHLSRRDQTQVRQNEVPLTPDQKKLRDQLADIQPTGMVEEELEDIEETGVPKTNPLNTGGSGLASQLVTQTTDLNVTTVRMSGDTGAGGGGGAPVGGTPVTRVIVPIPTLP